MRQVFNDRSVLFLGCDPLRTEYKNFFQKFAVNAKVMQLTLAILNPFFSQFCYEWFYNNKVKFHSYVN